MSKDMLKRLSAEQNHRCAYCGTRMVVPGFEKRKAPFRASMPMGGINRGRKNKIATKDHIVPKCDGGRDIWDNLVAACWWCNNFRGNRPACEAYDKIASYVRRGTHPHQQFEKTGRWPKSFVGMRSLTPDQRQTWP